jgi:hypothetical protein
MMSVNRIITSILIGLLLTTLIIACSNTGNSSDNIDLTKNSQLKEQAFDQILNNQDLFNDFMDHMMKNQQSMQWMMGQNQMMQYMFNPDHMQFMMQQNSGMRQHMMEGWMNTMQQDSSIYNQMYQMMQQHHMGSGMNMGMMHN